jgi:hypothetical protein
MILYMTATFHYERKLEPIKRSNIEDTKGVIRSLNWKYKQCNGQRTNNDLQNTTQKTNDRATDITFLTLYSLFNLEVTRLN